ncbi:hypothetical protein KJZ61_02765 [Candidatus Dependentiae bacterium]|nr:hypothetical protein [Candidatus Dependentiae bacterium]
MKNNFSLRFRSTLYLLISTQMIFCVGNETTEHEVIDYIPNVVAHITEASQKTLHQAFKDFANNAQVGIHLDAETHARLMQLCKFVAALGLMFAGVSMINNGIKKLYKKKRRISSATHIISGLILSVGSLAYVIKQTHS